MKANLAPKDWIDISAYLDGRLSASDKAHVENQLKTNSQYHQAFQEIQYTCKLLRLLPAKKAPKNFTLSEKYAKNKSRRLGLRSFMGLTSATAALAVIVLFVGINVFKVNTSLMASAPAAARSEMSGDTFSTTTADSNSAPMIITWNQPNYAYGMGGGPAAASAKGDNGGYGGGGAPGVAPEAVDIMPPAAEQSLSTAADTASVDPSTLILGLPEPGTGGQIINHNTTEAKSSSLTLAASTIWMIGLGVVALVSGLLAVFLRRR